MKLEEWGSVQGGVRSVVNPWVSLVYQKIVDNDGRIPIDVNSHSIESLFLLSTSLNWSTRIVIGAIVAIVYPRNGIESSRYIGSWSKRRFVGSRTRERPRSGLGIRGCSIYRCTPLTVGYNGRRSTTLIRHLAE